MGKMLLYAPELTVENVVGEERLHLQYLLTRYFCAGAERYIVDQKLGSLTSQHQAYSVFKYVHLNTLRELKYLILGKRNLKKQLIYILKNASFALGYFRGQSYLQAALS
jgi:hypothetical protein